MRTRTALVVLALGQSVSLEAQEEGYRFQDSEVVLRTLDEVMARPEFQRLQRPEAHAENPAWLERLLDWLEEWLASDDARAPDRALGGGEALLVYGVALLVVLGVLAFLLKSILGSTKKEAIAGDAEEGAVIRAGAAPGEMPPETYWNNAQALAAAGDYKTATRELLFAAMSTLERRGLIRHRRGLTSRDYLGAAPGAMRGALGTIVAAFERSYFGRRQATADGFDLCSRAYRQGFFASETPALPGEST